MEQLPNHICSATRDGRVCIRPPHEPLTQHRATDGKHWYYSDGEREAAMKQSIPEYLDKLGFGPER